MKRSPVCCFNGSLCDKRLTASSGALAKATDAEGKGGLGNQFYQWTPGMINDADFGVRIDVYPPVGRGSVVVYYDLVEITGIFLALSHHNLLK
jgi:hypothetical protein